MLFHLALLVAAVSASSSFCDEAPYTISWRDEFDTPTLNTTSWTAIQGMNIGRCRSAYCDPANVWISEGHLVLVSRRINTFPGYNYTTGAVETLGKAHWWPNKTFRLCTTHGNPSNSFPPRRIIGAPYFCVFHMVLQNRAK